MKFNPKTHIVGKVYDLTQDNMNRMIKEIESLKETIKGLEDDVLAEHQVLVDQFIRAGSYKYVLELVASPVRKDGTYNRDRRACELLAKDILFKTKKTKESNQEREVGCDTHKEFKPHCEDCISPAQSHEDFTT